MGKDTLNKEALQTKLKKHDELAKFVKKHPATRFVVPFVRTPLLSGPLTVVINCISTAWYRVTRW